VKCAGFIFGGAGRCYVKLNLHGVVAWIPAMVTDTFTPRLVTARHAHAITYTTIDVT